MAARPMLEDFAGPGPQTAPPLAGTAPAPLDEADRLAAYEQGYKAGWDDAARAESAEQERIGAELARNIQELSFTFHEARLEVTRAMQPLLTEMVTTLLPALGPDALAAVVADALRDVSEAARDVPLELAVAPQARRSLEARLGSAALPAVSVTEEPTLSEGQAFLRAGRLERHIDVTGVLDAMRAAVEAYFARDERTAAHG